MKTREMGRMGRINHHPMQVKSGEYMRIEMEGAKVRYGGMTVVRREFQLQYLES